MKQYIDSFGVPCSEKLNQMNINFINKSTNPDPVYTAGNSGFDLRANLAEPITLKSMERALVPTGLFFEIPLDYELQVRPRSGLALKNGITVLNSPGTVDSSYRGEVCIILYNTDKKDFIIDNGDRIAQGVICQVQQMHTTILNKVEELGLTERATAGFGSSGVK